jgi:hypothetical protein
MPKNTATDRITDQEIAFAHLVLSGTMDDRRAAAAVGLHPETAASIKAKPRVRAYMLEHRAAVEEKRVEPEAEDLRQRDLGRDQILARLWELANLSPEVTRGSIAGQIKALTMIVSIEALIPDRRRAPSQSQTAAPPVAPEIYRAQWLRDQEELAENPVTAEEDLVPAKAQPDTRPEPAPQPARSAPSPDLDHNQPSAPDTRNPVRRQSWVPAAVGTTFDALLDSARSRRPPFPRE